MESTVFRQLSRLQVNTVKMLKSALKVTSTAELTTPPSKLIYKTTTEAHYFARNAQKQWGCVGADRSVNDVSKEESKSNHRVVRPVKLLGLKASKKYLGPNYWRKCKFVQLFGSLHLEFHRVRNRVFGVNAGSVVSLFSPESRPPSPTWSSWLPFVLVRSDG